MKIDLYRWYGPMKVDSGLYDARGVEGDEKAHAYLEITRGKDQVNVWICTQEEAEALIQELNTILEHLEDQDQEVA